MRDFVPVRTFRAEMRSFLPRPFLLRERRPAATRLLGEGSATTSQKPAWSRQTRAGFGARPLLLFLAPKFFRIIFPDDLTCDSSPNRSNSDYRSRRRRGSRFHWSSDSVESAQSAPVASASSGNRARAGSRTGDAA